MRSSSGPKSRWRVVHSVQDADHLSLAVEEGHGDLGADAARPEIGVLGELPGMSWKMRLSRLSRHPAGSELDGEGVARPVAVAGLTTARLRMRSPSTRTTPA